MAKRNGLLDLDVYNAANIDSIDSDRRRPAVREPVLAGK